MIIFGPFFGWQLELNRREEKEIWPGSKLTKRRIGEEAILTFGQGTRVQFRGKGESGCIFPPGYGERELLWSWETERGLRYHLDIPIPDVIVRRR